MKKLLLITIAILILGCSSNTEKATDLNYEAAKLYNQATAAENWRYQYEKIGSKSDVIRLTKERDSLSKLAAKYVDSAKNLMK